MYDLQKKVFHFRCYFKQFFQPSDILACTFNDYKTMMRALIATLCKDWPLCMQIHIVSVSGYFIQKRQ
jgi:hypothetical protein